MPDQADIEVGSEVQLEVEGIAEGTSVQWAASSEEIASVDSIGRVFGKKPGRATVTASTGTALDSATVEVREASSPSPRAHRVLSDNPWNALTAGPWKAAWNQRGHFRIVNDRSAPRSCCKVAEFFYPRGFEAGRAPASADLSLGAVRSLYVSAWWKASRGWHGHPSGVNKLMFVFPSNAPGNWYVGWYGKESLRVAPQHPRGWEWLRSEIDDSPLKEGQWYQIELLLEHRSGELWDVKWWVDGTLRGAHHRVRWTDAPLTTLKVNPTWGGTNGRKNRNDHFRWDHIYISGG